MDDDDLCIVDEDEEAAFTKSMVHRGGTSSRLMTVISNCRALIVFIALT